MPNYSNGSLLKLSTCDPRLILLMNEVIKHVDIAITCGHRDQVDQDQAFAEKKSKLRFPNSKHNSSPSMAVDFVPFKGGKAIWNDPGHVTAVAFFIHGIAAAQGLKIRLGCDWNGNFETKDESFLDAFHLEIAE